MKGQRSLLIKGAAWVTAAGLLVNLLGLVSLLVLTRILMPEDFGLVAIAGAFIEIITLVTELSLATALIQRRDLKPAHFHTAFTLNVIRAMIVGTILFFSGGIIASAYGDPRLSAIIQTLALATLVGGFTNPKLILFQRDLDFSKGFIIRVTDKLVTFVVTVTVAFIYQSYWALIIGIIASSLTTLVVSYVILPYRPRFAVSAWRDLLSFSIWLTLGQWVQALNWRAQPLLFGFFLPTNVVGQYNVGRRLVGQTIAQATQPVQRILFPAFSRLQDHKERLRSGYMRSQGTICLVTFPIGVGFAVLAEDLVLLAIGEKWLPAAPVIKMVAVARTLQSLQNVNALAMATAHTKSLFYRDLRAFLIRWPLLLGGMFLGGSDPYDMLLGALAGQLVAVLINSLWNIQLISQISTISIRDHAAFVWRPLVGVAAMAAVVALAHAVSPPVSDWFGLALRTALLSALGAATYFASLYLIWRLSGRKDCVEAELIQIIRSLIAKAFGRARTT